MVDGDPRGRRRPRSASVALFDIYRGPPLATDEKSLAYRLTFRADERTLTEAEIDAALARGHRGPGRDRRPDPDLSPACRVRIGLVPCGGLTSRGAMRPLRLLRIWESP